MNKLVPTLILSALLSPAACAQGDTPVTAIANPQAVSSGSVVNSATQVLNGPYHTNSYGGGIMCQGPTLNVSPFLTTSVSGQYPYESYADLDGDGIRDRTGQKNSWSFNPGISATISIPLDNRSQDLCYTAASSHNERIQAETAKARLDFELVRLLRCGEAVRAGDIATVALLSSSSNVTLPPIVYSVLKDSAVSSASVNDRVSAALPIVTFGDEKACTVVPLGIPLPTISIPVVIVPTILFTAKVELF